MNKILILVDCQNDFIDGALRNEEAIKTVPNIVNYVKNFDGEIICTFDSHNQNYLNTLEGKKLPISHCLYKSDGWQLNTNIQKAINNKQFYTVTKHTFGSIYNLKKVFNQIKKKYNNQIDEIIICGFCTDICVISNSLIIRTLFPSVKITVLKNCCAGTSIEANNAALTVMKSCQIDIK